MEEVKHVKSWQKPSHVGRKGKETEGKGSPTDGREKNTAKIIINRRNWKSYQGEIRKEDAERKGPVDSCRSKRTSPVESNDRPTTPNFKPLNRNLPWWTQGQRQTDSMAR